MRRSQLNKSQQTKPIENHWYVTYIYTRRLTQPGKGIVDFGSGLMGFDIKYFPIRLAASTIIKQNNFVSITIVSWQRLGPDQYAEFIGQLKGQGNVVN